MRIVDFLIFYFGISLAFGNGMPAMDNCYGGCSLFNRAISLRKRDDDGSNIYLEQCGLVKFPNVQSGVVNVVAFLDSSWPYSHKQATMLKMLHQRFQKSCLPDTLFFVVNVSPHLLGKSDTMNDDIEKEAWFDVSPDEISKFSEIEKTYDSLTKDMNPDIKVIQDNEELNIWKKLGGSRDQVLVIDRCGRLTYQVIVPWSILHFPYVKAAILSTYKDEPCGPCHFNNKKSKISFEKDDLRESVFEETEMKFDSRTEESVKRVLDLPEDDKTTISWSATTTESISTDLNLNVEEAIPPVLSTVDNIEETLSLFLPNSIEDDTTMLAISGTRINENYNAEYESEVTDETINNGTTIINKIVEIPQTTSALIYYETEKSQILKINETLIDSKSEHYFTDPKITISGINFKNLNNNYSDPEDMYETTSNGYLEAKTKRRELITNLNETDNTTSGLAAEESTDSLASAPYTFQIKFTNFNNTNTNISEFTSPNMASNDFETVNFEETSSAPILDYFNERIFETVNVTLDPTTDLNNPAGKDADYYSTPVDGASRIALAQFRHFEEQTAIPEMADPSTYTVTEFSDFNTKDEMYDTTNNFETTINEDTEYSQYISREKQDEGREEPSYMPIRIIMHAPHFHADSDLTRMHEYLILNTGNPKSHGHLGSEDAVKLYRGPQDHHVELASEDTDAIEKKEWPMKNLIYTKDESTGMFGEISDYWRDIIENYEYADVGTEESDYEQNYEKEPVNENISNETSIGSNEKIQTNEEIIDSERIEIDITRVPMATTETSETHIESKTSTEIHPTGITEKFYSEEEEKRNKIIAHYSKLLPWIYYILDK